MVESAWESKRGKKGKAKAKKGKTSDGKNRRETE
jgi:hypothetical protein